MTKSELRKLFLEKRKSLSESESAALSGQIAELFFDAVDFRPIKKLHCFIPIVKFNEIDTSLILEKLWTRHPKIQTVAPRVDSETNEIRSRIFRPASELVKNNWGIPEPIDGENIEPEQIDLVIVPLLCFDKIGHRVGYGKGMYDRLLAQCRIDCLKVGIDYFSPVGSISDLETTDIRLDMCVTPTGVYRFDSK